VELVEGFRSAHSEFAPFGVQLMGVDSRILAGLFAVILGFAIVRRDVKRRIGSPVFQLN